MTRNKNPEGTCFYCGKTIHFLDRTCAFCGRENDAWREISEKQCGNCHADLENGDKYCRICGTRVGDGAYDPYQDIMQCIYGPAPVRRKHTCRQCGNIWSTYLMLDAQKYCPKCGGYAPYSGETYEKIDIDPNDII